MNQLYVLRNESAFFQDILETESFEECLSGLLTIVCERVKVLKNFSDVTNINFDDLYILTIYKTTTFKYPIDKTTFNLNTNEIINSSTTVIKESISKYPSLSYIVSKLNNLMNKKTKTIIPKEKEEEDIKIEKRKIPLMKNDNNDNNNNNDNDVEDMMEINDDITLEELELEIKKLQALKETSVEELEKIKEEYKVDQENYSEYKCELDGKKMEQKLKEENIKQRERIFEVDLETYLRIKKDLDDGSITENNISPLYIRKYPIFKFLDENDLLENDDLYETYLILYNELYPEKPKDQEKDYIPHNINYLEDEEKEQYSHIKEGKEDMINSFVKNTNKIPPLDQILKELDQEDSKEKESFNKEKMIEEMKKKHEEYEKEIDSTLDNIVDAFNSDIPDDTT
ncbi:MAG: hypothetical protein CMF62_01670 [Magnetococcales bacterium]|nr:hypothetical protein [Magnetococcales bacterium]|tara:strand:- start:65696 stop:66892 length:1197 start_codon:yes stop_codon:yes gene_type:complete